MRKLEIDGKEVKGYIIHETPMEKIVWLEEPAPYQCPIICHLGKGERVSLVDILKSGYGMANCIDMLFAHGPLRKKELRQKLRFEVGKYVEHANSTDLVRSIMKQKVLNDNDARHLYSLLRRERNYWHSEFMKKFEEYFDITKGKIQLLDLPKFVFDILVGNNEPTK